MVNSLRAMEFPRRRFILFDSIAVTAWAAYDVGIGAVADSCRLSVPVLACSVDLQVSCKKASSPIFSLRA